MTVRRRKVPIKIKYCCISCGSELKYNPVEVSNKDGKRAIAHRGRPTTTINIAIIRSLF